MIPMQQNVMLSRIIYLKNFQIIALHRVPNGET